MDVLSIDPTARTQEARDHEGEIENEPAGPRPDRRTGMYRELFERSADAILVIENGTFVDCNQATVDMLRYHSREQLLQTHPSQLSPEYQPDGRLSFEKANEMMALAVSRGSHRFEWQHKRADGEVFPVEVLLTTVPKNDGMIIHTVWRDISERKRLQNELHQSQKLEAIGKLAGGIAHDFNNLLVAIMGNGELLGMDLETDSPLQEYVEEIQRAGKRAADLVGQLLAYSRKQVLRTSVLDLNETLIGLSPMLRHLTGDGITTTTNLSKQPLNVRADAGQLGQVVMNLVTNARDSMPDGGALGIETEEVDLRRRPSIGGRNLAPGCYAALRVIDGGSGISPEILDRMFDPFFTTKPQGTGLGLSTAIGIFHQSNGEVTVESAPTSGTVFTVYLPLTDEPATPDAEPEPRAVEPARAGETILLVEDEPSVTRVVERILRDEGYEVHSAGDGREALARIEAENLAFDLLLTDVVMPNMDGPELVSRLAEIRPDLKVLYASGHTYEALTNRGDLENGVELIQKPYSSEQLKRRVRRILDA